MQTMDTILFIQMLFYSSFLSNVYSNRTFPIGHPRACDIETKPFYVFEVLPGLGWDNLVNKNRGMVIHFNYSKCKTTADQRYLIPDGIVTIPIKSSSMHVFSKTYDHWSDYKTDTSFSINLDASVKDEGTISGSFSTEFEHVKSKQIEDKSLTTKVQARYVRYTAEVLSDAQLDPSFRSRLLKIANHIQHNRKSSARYESELLVRDFGTHVITTIDAGASIVKVDQVKSSIKQETTMNKLSISLAASYSFPILEDYKASSKISISDNDIEKYITHLTDSNIRTYGGPALNPDNFTFGKWVSEIADDLVAVDRNGFPLVHFVTTTTLPELSEYLVHELTQSISTAILTYYTHNKYPGCTKMDAPNFSYIANVNDGTCHTPLTNFSFGGVFQTCDQYGDLMDENLCGQFGTKNPKTQSYSCPVGYEQILLYTSETSKSQQQHTCQTCYLFFSCCKDESYFGTANFTTYWCHAPKDSAVSQHSGYIFGGLYSDTTNNFVTQSQSCPRFYLPLTITSNVHVCVSDDYELGTAFAVPFGGFYSCSNGNPMASVNASKSCPHGYSSHLATIDNNCEIMYCVFTGFLSNLKSPLLKIPPFTKIPAESIKPLANANYIISHNGQSWMHLIESATTNHELEENKWTPSQSAQMEISNLIIKFNNNQVKIPAEKNISRATGFGLSVGFMTTLCLTVGIIVVIK
ncbi:macrophage-expressed gene 1 protein-like [Mytilus californianus]|uniref:macrophage-expressed gene 1 protein-like n=1 Tax=Mytilus californianus TaxID=6549 RepID=UPI0022484B2C|nr:macrophage-expressed gene 1 protein-like [Mytilus californianus]